MIFSSEATQVSFHITDATFTQKLLLTLRMVHCLLPQQPTTIAHRYFHLPGIHIKICDLLYTANMSKLCCFVTLYSQYHQMFQEDNHCYCGNVLYDMATQFRPWNDICFLHCYLTTGWWGELNVGVCSVHTAHKSLV